MEQYIIYRSLTNHAWVVRKMSVFHMKLAELHVQSPRCTACLEAFSSVHICSASIH